MSLEEIEIFTSVKQCPLCGHPRFWQPRLIGHRLGEYVVHHLQMSHTYKKSGGGIVAWIGVSWFDPSTRAEPMHKICVRPHQFVQEITGQATAGWRIA